MKILLIALIMLSCAVSQAELNMEGNQFSIAAKAASELTDTLLILTAKIKTGYHPTGQFDTVKVVLLVTSCENCQSRSVAALAIRERYRHHGDPMPIYFNDGRSVSYEDDWRVKSFLMADRKPFSANVIIWDHKFLNQTIK